MGRAVKGLAVLGSTGSVGRQTLEVVRQLGGHLQVVALAARQNVTLLAEQAQEFGAQFVWAEQNDGYLKEAVADGRLGANFATMPEMACHPDVDIVVVATVGKAGLGPTLAALNAGKIVALANKEVLVMAGHIVTQIAQRHGGELRPVDSEHSAIWQCLWGESTDSVAQLILTASGGPFRDTSLEELERVTPQQALRHPTWNMGNRITVDSATLFNKGMETIEARWLFDLPFDKIGVVIHRESIVHSMVEFSDGSIKAQLGLPDMRLPIQCALTYPQRLPVAGSSRLDLGSIGALHFSTPDPGRFPCLALAMEAGRRGGTYPAVAAAADEIAVEHFLAGDIGFMEIPRVVEGAMSAHDGASNPPLDEVLAADTWARRWAQERIKARVR